MFPSGMRFISESLEYEARHHAASPENIAILEKHQIAFDAALDAHMAGKIGSRFEAAVPLYQLMGLVSGEDLNRDFLTGKNT